MKDIKEELLKCREFPHSRIGRLNTVKMSVLPNLIHRFNIITIKIPASYWMEVYMERQKAQKSQDNTEGREQSWMLILPGLKIPFAPRIMTLWYWQKKRQIDQWTE